MVSPTEFRCDRRYLRVRMLVELSLTVVLSILVGLASVVAACIVGALLALMVIFGTWVRSTYRFTLHPDSIQTQKLFTQHIDVTTPIARIQSVSAHEGILEAMLDVGTLEISTASSHDDHASFRWPHLASSREVAARMQEVLTSQAKK